MVDNLLDAEADPPGPRDRHPLLETATEVGGAHPTGMHFCMIINVSIPCADQCIGGYRFEKTANTISYGGTRHVVHETVEQCQVGHLIPTKIASVLLIIVPLRRIQLEALIYN